MMKIVTDEELFNLDIETNNVYLVSSIYNKKIFDCLNSYFGQKKKNLCNIFDENENAIDNKLYNFVYFPNEGPVESNIYFKQKSILNSEISKIINTNPEEFMSIEKMRNEMYELLTDSGMYKIRKIINKGIKETIDLEINEFDIKILLQMLCLSFENCNDERIYMIIYNLLIYLNRNTLTIIYLDINISDEICEWLNSLKNTNLIILINNDSYSSEKENDYNLIIVSNCVSCVKYDFDSTLLGLFSYLFKPLVISNIQYQTEKNIKILNYFNDKNTTFLLKFAKHKLQ